MHVTLQSQEVTSLSGVFSDVSFNVSTLVPGTKGCNTTTQMFSGSLLITDTEE